MNDQQVAKAQTWPQALEPPPVAHTGVAPVLPTHTANEADFARLFARYQPAMLHFARRFVNRDAADDIVQEVFVTTWHHRGWIDRDDEVQRRMLYKAVRNRVANANRGAFREHRRLNRYWRDILTVVRNYSPIAHDIEEDLVDQVERIARRMPPRVREVWTLVRDHERSYAEVAEIMGIDVHTVGAHLSRANRIVREALAQRGWAPATSSARRPARRPA
jgi:RNA polymerase sigma factor (sigma-70 family)